MFKKCFKNNGGNCFRRLQLCRYSVLFTPEDTRHLVAVVGAGQVILGTDYPTLWNRTPVDRILAIPGLSDVERKAIVSGTLTKLLTRSTFEPADEILSTAPRR
jgi:hypothetical protein